MKCPAKFLGRFILLILLAAFAFGWVCCNAVAAFWRTMRNETVQLAGDVVASGKQVLRGEPFL